MYIHCGKCLGVIKSFKSGSISLFCASNRQFHSKCVGVPDSLQDQFVLVPGLSWKYSDCMKKCFVLDSDSLK